MDSSLPGWRSFGANCRCEARRQENDLRLRSASLPSITRGAGQCTGYGGVRVAPERQVLERFADRLGHALRCPERQLTLEDAHAYASGTVDWLSLARISQ